jgi:phosphoribosylformylglycinamidine synthase PurS subunit
VKYRAQIHVTYRPGVLDPQAKAVREALDRMGFAGVTATRAGKWFEIDLDAGRREQAEQMVESMCSRLLAHPVVEQYTFCLEDLDSEGCSR